MLLCGVASIIYGKNKIPKIIKSYSNKKYGRRDDLSRYYSDKYMGIKIGKYTYGWEKLNRHLLKSIGSFSSIAEGVKLVPNTHKIDFITTSPIMTLKSFNFIEVDRENEYFSDVKQSITIGNDVWIGADSIIFDNVVIGDGAVIGANSIIRKDVPPYAIVTGVDRIIKYRFDSDVIAALRVIKWWEWEDNRIKANLPLMYDHKNFIQAWKDGFL